jgi:hypothetical protein
MSNLSDASQSTEKQSLDTASEAPASPKPTLSRGSLKRASSVFGSIRGYRLPTEDDEPLSATSTRASTGFGEYLGEDVRDRQVLQYGEVQTSSSMFRKKREYLVLTEKHLIRFKTHAKAAEAFPSIPSPYTRTNSYRHSQNPSTGSSHELQSLASESSGDRHHGIPLRHVVAVYHLDDDVELEEDVHGANQRSGIARLRCPEMCKDGVYDGASVSEGGLGCRREAWGRLVADWRQTGGC